MSSSLYNAIFKYKVTLALVDKMVADGIISKEEYSEIDTIIAEKYGISSCSIYRPIA